MDLPIFPLNTVLFPGGRLPLRIFEARYVDMTKACIRDNSVFGVCLIREGLEVGRPAAPCEIGCTARIVQWEVPHAGLFSLVTEGETVFRIRERSVSPAGLISAKVDFEEPPASVPMPASHEALSHFLGEFIGKIGAAQFSQPLRLDDAAWVSYRLAEILPLGAPQRLALLEVRDPLLLVREIENLIRKLG
jgi:Lon protease-like protein